MAQLVTEMYNTLGQGILPTLSLHQAYTWHTPSIRLGMVCAGCQAVATVACVVLYVKGLLKTTR